MPNQSRLNKRIDDLQQQLDLLDEKLSELSKQLILETRSDEKLRLKKSIDDTTTLRDQIEKQLKGMESQRAKVDSDTKEGAGRNDDQGRAKLDADTKRNDGVAKQHVFISYCRDNSSEITQLRKDLMDAGEQVWWDQDILPGLD